VRASLAPPDAEHRLGHGNAETLPGLRQSNVILASAGYTDFEPISRRVEPKRIKNSVAGIVVVVIAILLTLGLVAYQRHVVQQSRSLAIEADSIHYRGDLLMNLSVIAALILSGYFGLHWADAVFGILIALLIAWSAGKVVIRAFAQLMDQEFSDQDRERIKEIARSHSEVVNLHDLRTRRSGVDSFIQFHLELDGEMKLKEVHRISDEVRDEIMAAFPGSEVLIHQDPAGSQKLTSLQQSCSETGG